MSDFNQFANGRFARTQPQEWRDMPFEDNAVQWSLWLKVAGVIVVWLALFAVSLWSINDSVSQQTYARTK